MFYPPRPDYRRFKIPSLTSPGHTHSPVCVPTATFSFSRAVMWVIRYHISYLSQLCITVLIYSHKLREKKFLRALTASKGGGGHVPPASPLVSITAWDCLQCD